MLNKEKYRDKIFEIAVNHDTFAMVNGKPCPCSEIDDCCECDFYEMYENKNCDDALREWVNAEYKESEIDWTKVPVDTPVLVANYEDESTWNRRYFYRYHDFTKNSRQFEVFIDGATSWSAGLNEITLYKYCKLAREEDIKKYRKR